jgi:hypothetical protein
MQAQRSLIAYACDAIRGLEGPVLELGLGRGRTYDHLRETFPERRVIVLDLKVTGHLDAMPPAEDLILGDIRETGQRLIGIGAAFLHSDIGPGKEHGVETALWLPALVPQLLTSGGVALSDEPLDRSELAPLPLPDGIEARRYFLYRRK